MSERTRASGDATDRTVTDIGDEKDGWTEPALDEGMDRDALSGSRPGDQVTPEMLDKDPSDSDRDDFAGTSDPRKRVNDERPHSPRSKTQR